MARRHVPIAFTIPEDTRPSGTVRFADQTTAEMAERINTFNEPHNPQAHGHQEGFKPTFGRPGPWSQRRDGEEAFHSMHRKRGVADDEE